MLSYLSTSISDNDTGTSSSQFGRGRQYDVGLVMQALASSKIGQDNTFQRREGVFLGVMTSDVWRRGDGELESALEMGVARFEPSHWRFRVRFVPFGAVIVSEC